MKKKRLLGLFFCEINIGLTSGLYNPIGNVIVMR